MNPVELPPGRARLETKPLPIGSATFTNTIGIVRVSLNKCDDYRSALTHDRVRPQIDQLFCERPDFNGITGAPPNFSPQIAAFGPPKLCKSALERRYVRLRAPIGK